MTENEFISIWTEKIRDERLKDFPADFLKEEKVARIKMPGRAMMMGAELFGSVELVDTDGDVHFMCESSEKAKYILYANRNHPLYTEIPENEEDLATVLKRYENFLDSLLNDVKNEFLKSFKAAGKFAQVSNSIFRNLKLSRL